MTWTSIFIAGLITYFTRMSMVTLIDKDIFSENFRKILNFVPSVVFPSIIFPGVLLDDYGTLVAITDPKIYADKNYNSNDYLKKWERVLSNK